MLLEEVLIEKILFFEGPLGIINSKLVGLANVEDTIPFSLVRKPVSPKNSLLIS